MVSTKALIAKRDHDFKAFRWTSAAPKPPAQWRARSEMLRRSGSKRDCWIGEWLGYEITALEQHQLLIFLCDEFGKGFSMLLARAFASWR